MHFSVYLFHANIFFPWLIKRVCEVGEVDLLGSRVIITRGVMTFNCYVFSFFSTFSSGLSRSTIGLIREDWILSTPWMVPEKELAICAVSTVTVLLKIYMFLTFSCIDFANFLFFYCLTIDSNCYIT